MDTLKKNNSSKDGSAGKTAETNPPGNAPDAQGKTAKSAVPAASPKLKIPPMFRSNDWLALAITFITVWAVYLWTLAPELTLEDSGELCTGSYYAGIPHPPGYPFWAIYSYLWTVIVPFGNVAWRVEVGQSFASAFGCGLLALMVSRGGSMLIEGLEDLKAISRRWENWICVVAGVVAGMLLGLGGYMWKESVVINRISIFGVPWMLAVIVMLFRWSYAPQQRIYLYIGMLFFGWCATIHQSLILCAPAVEVVIALVLPVLGRDLFAVNSLFYLVILAFIQKGGIPALDAMTHTEKFIFHIVGIASIGACVWLTVKTNKFFTEWFSVIMIAVMSALGLMVYLYEPISCMTCPPMQWGYPRTVEGFFHALSRGQYGVGEGTNLLDDPRRFVYQLWYLAQGLSQTFSWFFMFIGLLPFLFLHKMHRRERSWIIGLTAIYFFLSVLLVIILNVTPDRSTTELNMVFFTASHGVFAIMVGYGMVILAAYMANNYQKFRQWGLIGGAIGVLLTIYCLIEAIGPYFGKAGQMKVGWLPSWGGWGFLAFGPDGQFGLTDIPHLIAHAFAPNHYGSAVIASLILIAMPVLFLVALGAYKNRGPVAITLALFCLAPIWSGMSHWYKSEQRDHWFGYWFGHDMFTPPFYDNGKLSYDNTRRAEVLKDPAKGKLIYPEMTRDAILYGGTDPGRFCPTYIIFCESFIPHWCQPVQDQKFDRRDVYIITQNALADGTYLEYLRSQYNRSAQIDPPFFSRLFKYMVCLGTGIGAGNIAVDNNSDLGSGESGNAVVEGIASLLYNVLDRPFMAWGAHVEKKRRAEGVYPKAEIYIPTPDDSSACFQEYARQKQLQAPDGKIEISGQYDVMAINGMLCKVIFDHCPTNEFFVEESFPLDWMYPYETPFGVIMKINRNPVTELSQDDLNRDHEFWSHYTERLCGNWITYDTTVQQIADFVDQTYLHNNYEGFKGDRRFVRDEDAQKAFSKLRSSQAGMYAWRLDPQHCPAEYRQKSPETQQALIRETDFAFKQAFAFCPFSPEAVFRYVNFLLQYGRFDDAVLVAKTCQKLDPFNTQITDTIKQLENIRDQNVGHIKAMAQFNELNEMARTNPDNITNLVILGGLYMQMQQTGQAMAFLDKAINNPKVTDTEAQQIAQMYEQLGDMKNIEVALRKLVVLAPDVPEHHYNLAKIEAMTGRNAEALADLKTALDLNTKRLAHDPTAVDILKYVRSDPNLGPIRNTPEYQKMVPPQ